MTDAASGGGTRTGMGPSDRLACIAVSPIGAGKVQCRPVVQVRSRQPAQGAVRILVVGVHDATRDGWSRRPRVALVPREVPRPLTDDIRGHLVLTPALRAVVGQAHNGPSDAPQVSPARPAAAHSDSRRAWHRVGIGRSGGPEHPDGSRSTTRAVPAPPDQGGGDRRRHGRSEDRPPRGPGGGWVGLAPPPPAVPVPLAIGGASPARAATASPLARA